MKKGMGYNFKVNLIFGLSLVLLFLGITIQFLIFRSYSLGVYLSLLLGLILLFIIITSKPSFGGDPNEI